MKCRAALIRRLIPTVLSIILICSVLPGLSAAEQLLWDCPLCGRTGNAGKFCSNCGEPASSAAPDPADVFSFEKLVRMYDTNYVRDFYDMREDAKKWIAWTVSSAPQSLEELPLFPDFVLPLYQSLRESEDKLYYKIEDTGSTYTVRSNIAEKFELISSDEYYNAVSPAFDKVMLLLIQNESGSAQIRDIEELDSSDSSISFSYPAGTDVRIDAVKYQFTYRYYDYAEEKITIDLWNPESANPYFTLDVSFSDADTSICYRLFGEEIIEIEVWDHSGKITGTEWLDYDLQSGGLVYWDMDYYEAEDGFEEY